ncbi:MAG: ABC transporter ATP-binding protein [candidate division Zixibacteria bacterium]
MHITIEGLTKRYPGGNCALRDVNLEIGNGLFGLLGPNGAGKTTLMRILVTLLSPTEGNVKIDGIDIVRYRKKIRSMVGYLPQGFSEFSKQAVWEFLDYAGALAGIKSRKLRMASVDRLLDEVGLFDVRDRKANRLSGGMKRRLGIAQVLIGDPKIMIVDEPTVGLDPQERLRFRNLMADLTRKEIIIILSTHIVGDISSTCSDMALLANGKIVYNGAPTGLTSAAEGKVWHVTAADHELDMLKEKYPVISAVPGEDGYHLRLVADHVEGKTAELVEASLEDAYICYMQKQGQEMDLESAANGW